MQANAVIFTAPIWLKCCRQKQRSRYAFCLGMERETAISVAVQFGDNPRAAYARGPE